MTKRTLKVSDDNKVTIHIWTPKEVSFKTPTTLFGYPGHAAIQLHGKYCCYISFFPDNSRRPGTLSFYKSLLPIQLRSGSTLHSLSSDKNYHKNKCNYQSVDLFTLNAGKIYAVYSELENRIEKNGLSHSLLGDWLNCKPNATYSCASFVLRLLEEGGFNDLSKLRYSSVWITNILPFIACSGVFSSALLAADYYSDDRLDEPLVDSGVGITIGLVTSVLITCCLSATGRIASKIDIGGNNFTTITGLLSRLEKARAFENEHYDIIHPDISRDVLTECIEVSESMNEEEKSYSLQQKLSKSFIVNFEEHEASTEIKKTGISSFYYFSANEKEQKRINRALLDEPKPDEKDSNYVQILTS